MRPTSLLSSALLLAATCAAWPAESDASTTVEKREGNTATTVSSSTQSSESGSAAASTGSVTGSNSKQTGTATTGGPSSGKKGGSDSEPTTQTFNPEDPAGGLSMITPAVTAAASYYKIKDHVTFAWNYTSLSVTPSYIDILASCSSNQETWTIALNQSVAGPTQAVTWDTGAYQATATLPLLTGEYTLLVFDAQKPITAAPSPGYLAPFSAFTFGMYTPQPYQDLNTYVCATCNAAVAAAKVQTVWFLLGTAGVTVLSAAWFSGVAGLW